MEALCSCVYRQYHCTRIIYRQTTYILQRANTRVRCYLSSCRDRFIYSQTCGLELPACGVYVHLNRFASLIFLNGAWTGARMMKTSLKKDSFFIKPLIKTAEDLGPLNSLRLDRRGIVTRRLIIEPGTIHCSILSLSQSILTSFKNKPSFPDKPICPPAF